MPRRTKIVATIGPASESESMLRALINAGVDVTRLGLAHGTIDDALERYHRIRRVAAAIPAGTGSDGGNQALDPIH